MTKLLSNTETAERLGMSLSSLNRLRGSNPHFPRPLRFAGPRGRPRWEEGDIDAFIARQRDPAE